MVALWLADEETFSLRVGAVNHESPDNRLPDLTVSYGQGGVGVVAAARTPLEVDDVYEDSRFLGRAWWRSRALSSFLGLPEPGFRYGQTVPVQIASQPQGGELERMAKEWGGSLGFSASLPDHSGRKPPAVMAGILSPRWVDPFHHHLGVDPFKQGHATRHVTTIPVAQVQLPRVAAGVIGKRNDMAHQPFVPGAIIDLLIGPYLVGLMRCLISARISPLPFIPDKSPQAPSLRSAWQDLRDP